MSKSVKKTILIVEDDNSLLSALTAVLQEANQYRIIPATDGVIGLKKAIQSKPSLILLDLIMPHMSGQELLTALRNDGWGRTVPVIVLTNDASEKAQTAAYGSAAPAFYIKSNTSLREIRDAVHYHLN